MTASTFISRRSCNIITFKAAEHPVSLLAVRSTTHFHIFEKPIDSRYVAQRQGQSSETHRPGEITRRSEMENVHRLKGWVMSYPCPMAGEPKRKRIMLNNQSDSVQDLDFPGVLNRNSASGEALTLWYHKLFSSLYLLFTFSGW